MRDGETLDVRRAVLVIYINDLGLDRVVRSLGGRKRERWAVPRLQRGWANGTRPKKEIA